jgi:hypothetical protein
MKKAKLTVAILLLAMIFAFQTTVTIYAVHTPVITIEPEFGPGEYPEWKNFTVYNEGPDPIVKVVITYPETTPMFKPIEYKFPPGWTATPEPGLRQVIFESTDYSAYNIGAEHEEDFKILFDDGPNEEGTYVFIVSTTDKEEDAYTRYPEQTIDITEPSVTIDYPENNSVVYATYEGWPGPYYLWTNGTASDELSGVKHVKVRVYNETWDSGWVFATIENGHWYYKWYNIQCGWDYSVEAMAEDNAGNPSSTKLHVFKYLCLSTYIELTPDEGTVGPTTELDSETGWYEGSIYTYGSKTLGTTVIVDGFGFNENSMVSIYAGGLLVKEVEANSTGGFTTSFIFPTLPGGPQKVYAEDDAEHPRFASETFTVNPEIIYKPEIVIGPAVIEAIATGLPSDADVKGFTIDGTDALLTVNRHVVNYWYTDAKGVLHSHAAGNPGFSMPVLEPGTYEIALWRAHGEVEYTLIVANKLHVVNCFEDLCDKLDELELKLDDIKPIIEGIDDNVADIKTDVGIIKADVKDIIEDITVIKGNVAEIKTKVGTIEGKVESIAWSDVITIKTDVGTIKGNVEGIGTIADDVVTIKTDVGDIKVKVEEIPSPLSMNLAVVLSAIAAIAAIIAVVVVTKRLKVAA